MSYLGLARKWRPKTFEDLVGQKHIATTLQNAIRQDRISQGYLFTGTRGIGKTSSARILAKALRCSSAPQPGVPCNKCTDCIEIAEGRSIDVLEIDGASNNGVDAVRELRDAAKFLPSSGRYKIYIIDEVHMLTTAAFNALLKTLEEPPAHVVFIFATTDPQKIPATVLSRCQRFDFKRVSQKELQDHLRMICDSEKITVGDDALTILAREAEGSMRDGVSLLDQVLSSSENGKKISAQAVTNALGLVDKQTVLDCVSAILKREPLRALEAAGKVHLHGFDLKQFSREILRMIRTLMVVKLLEEKNADAAQYLDISDIDLEDLRELAPLRETGDLDMLFLILNHGLEDISRSSIPKTVLDVLLIKMASSDELIRIDQALESDTVEALPEKKTSLPPATNRSPLNSAPKTVAPTAAATPQKTVIDWSAAGVDLWKQAVQFVKSQKPLIGSVLEHLSFEKLEKQDTHLAITLGYTKDSSFYKDQLQSRAYAEQLQTLVKAFSGMPTKFNFVETASNKSLQAIEEEQVKSTIDKKRKSILESEALKATEQLLGAKLERLDLQN